MAAEAMTEREQRLLDECFHDLLYRQVGFEHFRNNPDAYVIVPKKIYVAQSGRFVLLGFHTQEQATRFWEFAMKAAEHPGV